MPFKIIGTGKLANTIPFNNGSATNPGLSFQGSQSSGLYHAGDGIISISVQGTEKTRVTSSGLVVNGNVSAESYVGNLDASYLTGTLDNARLPSSISVSNIAANGSALTSVNLANTYGTLSNTQLPSNISVSGNVSGSYIIGNGSFLTDLVVPGSFATPLGNTTAAVQSCLDNSLNVYLPADTYSITSSLTLRTGHTIYGESIANTLLIKTDFNGAVFLGIDTDDVTLGNFTIQGPGQWTGTGNKGILLDVSSNPVVNRFTARHINMTNLNDIGIFISSGYSTVIEHLTCKTYGYAAIYLYGGDAISITSCQTYNGLVGFRIDNTTTCVLKGCYAELNGLAYSMTNTRCTGLIACGAEAPITFDATHNGTSYTIDGGNSIELNSCLSRQDTSGTPVDAPHIVVKGNATQVSLMGFHKINHATTPTTSEANFCAVAKTTDISVSQHNFDSAKVSCIPLVYTMANVTATTLIAANVSANVYDGATFNSKELVIGTFAQSNISTFASNVTTTMAWSSTLGIYCAAVTSTSLRSWATSSDGTNWTLTPETFTNSTTFPVGGTGTKYISMMWVSSLGKFATIAYNYNTAHMALSSNGTTWTYHAMPTDAGPAGFYWVDFTWSSELGVFVAISSYGPPTRIATSPDGQTWTLRNTPNVGGLFENNWLSIAWSAPLGLFAVISNGGMYNGTQTIMTSPDGLVWTQRTDPFAMSPSNYNSVAYGNGRFVAIRNDGTSAISFDGITWTQSTVSNYTSFYDLTYIPELSRFFAIRGYVSTSSEYKFMSSEDGVTWTTHGSNVPITTKTNNDMMLGGFAWSPALNTLVSMGAYDAWPATSAGWYVSMTPVIDTTIRISKGTVSARSFLGTFNAANLVGTVNTSVLPSNITVSGNVSADSFSASKGYSVTSANPGVLVEKRYSANPSDRYGIGQYGGGTVRVYLGNVYNDASIRFCRARGETEFDDLMTIAHNGTTTVSGNLVAANISTSGNISAGNYILGNGYYLEGVSTSLTGNAFALSSINAANLVGNIEADLNFDIGSVPGNALYGDIDGDVVFTGDIDANVLVGNVELNLNFSPGTVPTSALYGTLDSNVFPTVLRTNIASQTAQITYAQSNAIQTQYIQSTSGQFGNISSSDIFAFRINTTDIGTSNLTVQTATISKTTEIVNTKANVSGLVIHDVSTGAIWHHTRPAANFTANFINVPQIEGTSHTVSLIIAQAAGYIPNAVQINGNIQTIQWLYGSIPTGTAGKTDVVTFVLLYAKGSWTVLGQKSSFG